MLIGLEDWAVRASSMIVMFGLILAVCLGPTIYHAVRAILAAILRVPGPTLLVFGAFGRKIADFYVGQQRVIIRSGLLWCPIVPGNVYKKVRGQSSEPRFIELFCGIVPIPLTEYNLNKFGASPEVFQALTEMQADTRGCPIIGHLKLSIGGVAVLLLTTGLLCGLWSWSFVKRINSQSPLIVAAVGTGSPAYNAGLRSGMLVGKVGGNFLNVARAEQSVAFHPRAGAAFGPPHSGSIEINSITGESQTISFPTDIDSGIRFSLNYVPATLSDGIREGLLSMYITSSTLPLAYVPQIIEKARRSEFLEKQISVPLNTGQNWPVLLAGWQIGTLLLFPILFGFMLGEILCVAYKISIAISSGDESASPVKMPGQSV